MAHDGDGSDACCLRLAGLSVTGKVILGCGGEMTDAKRRRLIEYTTTMIMVFLLGYSGLGASRDAAYS